MRFGKLDAFAFVLYAVGLSAFSFGFGTTYWRYINQVNMGLWQSCSTTSSCSFIGWWTSSEPLYHIYISRYILMASAVLALVALILILVTFITSAYLFKAIGILLTITGILTLGGNGVFVGLCYRYDVIDCSELSYSFYLNIVSSLFFLVPGMMMLCKKRDNSQVYPSEEWNY